MSTYTAVLVVPNELGQDYVEQQLERLGVVAFLGPGSLVDSGDTDDVVARTLELDGLRVRAVVERDGDGPALTVSGENCSLEGDGPGFYRLVEP